MRRIATPTEYEWLQPLQPINVFISWSAFVLGTAQLIFVINYVYSVFKGRKCEENPWESNTLEWSTLTPVPYYNFKVVPTVYRGPYEYSSEDSNGHGDWLPQDYNVAEAAGSATATSTAEAEEDTEPKDSGGDGGEDSGGGDSESSSEEGEKSD